MLCYNDSSHWVTAEMAAPLRTLWKGRMSFLPLPEANFDHHLGYCLIFPFYTPIFPLKLIAGLREALRWERIFHSSTNCLPRFSFIASSCLTL